MRVALDGVKEELPELPPGMVTMRIDADTGEPVGASDKNGIFEVFEESKTPQIKRGSSSSSPSNNSSPTNTDTFEDPF